MAKRKIIKIDEQKCNACGLCIPNCPEGAMQIIDNKARLISDLFCDGLGACLGRCPEGAITIEEREAERYAEKKVMENVVKQGKNVIKAHLEHLKVHGQMQYLKEAIDFLKDNKIEIPLTIKAPSATHKHAVSFECPGSKIMDFRSKEDRSTDIDRSIDRIESQLRQWPVQIMLVSPSAPYFNDAHLLIAADCVPFTYADFHRDLLKGKVLLVGCPKLDDITIYKEKITQIINNNHLKSITYAHMEVPCCFGLINIIQDAISSSGKDIAFKEITISIKGEKLK
jgi:NAD-dependent dihydropyrimidine dehydrogenase PreA subunit